MPADNKGVPSELAKAIRTALTVIRADPGKGT
jgi:hypothetical protein